jgi:transposase
MERRAPASGAARFHPFLPDQEPERGWRTNQPSTMMRVAKSTSTGRPSVRLTSFFRRVLNLTSPVKSVSVETDSSDRPVVVVEVKSRSRRARCGECNRKCRRQHGAREKVRSWRHLGMFGVRVMLRGDVRRVICARCGVRTTSVPWSRTGSLFTREFEDEVAWFLQHTDQTSTATYFGISWVTAGKIAQRVVAEKLDGSLLENLHFIGVDEISYGRPKKFLTVVVDHERGRVVWAAEGKSSETLGQFFQLLGAERSSRIEVVTMDMSAAYIKSVTEQIPQAEIVFDRFHVVRLLLDAIDEVRREQQRELEGSDERKILKKSRFPLLKNPWNLTRKEKQKLAAIQLNNRSLYRAYLLKESFQSVYDARSVEDADQRFVEWYAWARRSQLRPFVSLAETLRNYWPGIRRFIELRITNGPVEGYNSKIRMISHRAFGFHSANALIAMIMLLCSGIILSPLGHGNALHTL